jgi:hypothetical protein
MKMKRIYQNELQGTEIADGKQTHNMEPACLQPMDWHHNFRFLLL